MSSRLDPNVRAELWWHYPYCYWCGTETRLVRPRPGERQPRDMATIDHVHDRFERDRRRGVESPIVLACHGCNAARAEARTRACMAEHKFKSRAGIRGPLSEQQRRRAQRLARPTWPPRVNGGRR